MVELKHKTSFVFRGFSGMVLVSSIMMIVFIAIVVLSISLFVTARLKQADSQTISAQTVYLAQAGIQQALYDFRFRDLSGNGYFTKGQTNIDASHFFIVGGSAADVLMVNTSNVGLSPSRKDIENLKIQNTTNSNTITLDRIMLSWDNTINLRKININGSTLWSGNQGSPLTADLNPNLTLNTTPSIYNIDYLRFQSNMTGATVTAQFIMTDGSSKTVTIYPASNNNNFNITAMGKTSASSIYRTIQITYNALTGHVINHKEINVPVP